MNKRGIEFMRLLMADLKRDEGWSQYPYRCKAGALTIGYGRNLDAKGITKAEGDILLRNDIVEAQEFLQRLCPPCINVSDNRYRALINMMFNLGPGGFLTFRRMRQAIDAGDWERAADELMDSQAARDLEGRYERLKILIREG